MILALMLMAADPPRSIDGLPLGGIGQQTLPAKGCAAYLFTTGETRVLAAMAQPAMLRIALDGATTDLARASDSGAGTFGLAAETIYRGPDVTAVLDMTIAARDDLTRGAMVPAATLRIERSGKDSLVVPLAGLVGCQG